MRTGLRILVSRAFPAFCRLAAQRHIRVSGRAGAGFQLPLPYANFTALLDLPSDPAQVAAYLGDRFLLLLDLMIDHLRRLAEVDPAQLKNGPVRLSNLSYNVVMTTSYMHLVPRSQERFKAPSGLEISINSLGFAGMVLVKEQDALEEVKKVGVIGVLKEVGYRPVIEGDTSDAAPIEAKETSANDDEKESNDA